MLTESQVNAILPYWSQLAWYYSIELYAGTYTKGLEFNNIALTKKMLDNIDLDGTTAIDVGAMEGAMATIMTKRGASVLAADVIDLSDQVTLVQKAHGVHFSYFPDMPSNRLAERIFEIQTSKSAWPYLFREIGPTDKTSFGFDIVLSSGVLYHVLNPVDHLIAYRKLCKLDGLVVIECAVTISDDVLFAHAMRPNGMLYGGVASWFVSTAALDLFLRACFLQPLAFCYLSRSHAENVEIARLGVVSRAVNERAFNPQQYERHKEIANSELFINMDFAGLQPAALLTGRASKLLKLGMDGLYSAENGLPVSAFDSAESLTYTQEDLRLSLENRYDTH
jgi:hypothetical protein